MSRPPAISKKKKVKPEGSRAWRWSKGVLYWGAVASVWMIIALSALVGWYVWAYLTYFIGTRLLPEPETKADHGELLRTIGFASAPGLVRVLGVVPGLGGLAYLVGTLWMLIATVIAVRQALDYESTLRAVGVCLIGWLIMVAIQAAIFGLL